MNLKTKIFLRRKFEEYYRKNKIPAPKEISQREFGIGNLEKKINVRHKSFSSEIEMQNYLRREVPFFISYSIAYYEFPENQPMSEKNWLGADLVFDLDVEMELFEKEKLEKVKKETMNLINFLTEDFGFENEDIKVNFSGNHGYHVHVFSEKIKNLGSDERREIVDFVSGNIEFKEFWYPDGNFIRGPSKDGKGWQKKIFDGLYNFIKNSDKKELMSIQGIGEKKATYIYENKEKILKELQDGIYNSMTELIKIELIDRTRKVSGDPNVRISVIRDITSSLLQKIIEEKAVKVIASPNADKMVTIDTSRLIRLPDSLHGSSGLIAKNITLEELKNFNPLENAIAFKVNEIQIQLERDVPKFDFLSSSAEKFGPFREKEMVKVPEAVGIYLLLKGFGDFFKS